jgi:hypothetical protein
VRVGCVSHTLSLSLLVHRAIVVVCSGICCGGGRPVSVGSLKAGEREKERRGVREGP